MLVYLGFSKKHLEKRLHQLSTSNNNQRKSNHMPSARALQWCKGSRVYTEEEGIKRNDFMVIWSFLMRCYSLKNANMRLGAK